MIRFLKSIFSSADAHRADDSYTRQVTALAIDFLYRNLARISTSATLIPIVMVVVMWNWVEHEVLLAWCGLAILILAARLLLSRAYLRHTPAPQDAPRWGRYYSFTSLANGVLWGAAALLFFIPDSTVLQVFLFISMIGMSAGSITINAYWIESYYAFIFPALAMSILRLLMEGGFAYQGLAVLLIMLVAVLIQVAHSTRSSALAALRLRFENLDLVERLREEKEKAETASRDKTRFLASASHDLRQPVHALTLFADALQAELTGAKAQALLGNMNRSIDALNRLLGSLLDISKLDAGIVKPNLAHFKLHSIFDRLNVEYAPQAHAKGLTWSFNTGDLIAHSDAALLEIMLRNLIGNALNYTLTGGVEVLCTRQGEKIRVEIVDSGMGIPHDRHQDIFREFYQLANPERDRSKGLGLGLAIVDRLASLLQHRITLDSTPGKGSRFAVILPAGDAGAVVSAAAAQDYGQDDVRGMQILVVDDEADVREGMRAMLEGWGCKTVLAGSEQEALEKMTGSKQAPQVIIADYRLRDGKTGVQAIEQLRTVLGNDIPALIITGDTAPERLREAQASGHTLMHKPVQPGKLRAYLRRVQRRHPLSTKEPLNKA